MSLGASPDLSVLNDATVTRIAARLGATPAQIVLAWHLRRGVSAVPKSCQPQRLAENLAAASFMQALTEEDVTDISALDRKQR